MFDIFFQAPARVPNDRRQTAWRWLAFPALAMFGGLSAANAATTYTVKQKIVHGSVKGTIVTDGKTGTLAASDIIGWSLTLKGPGASLHIDNTDSVVQMSGADFSATAKNLLFNYNGSDNGFVAFVVNPNSGAQYWCNAVTSQGYNCAPGASVVPQTYLDPSAQYAARTGKKKLAKK